MFKNYFAYSLCFISSFFLFACGKTLENPRYIHSSVDKTMKTIPPTSFYSLRMKSIDGKEVDFSTYKGKKILIVNVASECGFTPQYSDLQKLHITKGDKVTILGFPSNDFGGQEPGTDAEIKSFCTKSFQKLLS